MFDEKGDENDQEPYRGIGGYARAAQGRIASDKGLRDCYKRAQ